MKFVRWRMNERSHDKYSTYDEAIESTTVTTDKPL